MKKHKHLDRYKRLEIEILVTKGYTKTEIAEVLGVHKSTVSREVNSRKDTDGVYRASVAQTKALVARLGSKYQGMKIQKNPVLQEKIVLALKEYQSPSGIAGRYEGISHVSIYKWLYSSYGQRYCKYLCTRRYRKRIYTKNKTKREMIPEGVSVRERPTDGIHWEGDLFVSSYNTVSVAVLVEQKSGYIQATRIPNRSPTTMVSAVQTLTKDIVVTDITWDRGIENRYHDQFNTTNYFCDPHSPWQKPYVESNIGFLRKWFVPKRTNLALYEEDLLSRHIDILNHKWRKSLGYKSPYEVARERGILRE